MMDSVVKPIYKHFKPCRWYNNLYDEIAKKEADWWKESVMHKASGPTPEALEEMK